MCPDHSDWFGNGGLDAQSRNADKSVVTKFLQAHPADYATKKLQVSSLVSGRGQIFADCNGYDFIIDNITTTINQ